MIGRVVVVPGCKDSCWWWDANVTGWWCFRLEKKRNVNSNLLLNSNCRHLHVSYGYWRCIYSVCVVKCNVALIFSVFGSHWPWLTQTYLGGPFGYCWRMIFYRLNVSVLWRMMLYTHLPFLVLLLHLLRCSLSIKLWDHCCQDADSLPDLDSRLAYPRPRPRLSSFKTKTKTFMSKTKTQDLQDQYW